MIPVAAFVGHSFREEDDPVVRAILDYLDTVARTVPGFTWEHAKGAEPKEVGRKVLEKIEGKTLFIGICTANESVAPSAAIQSPWYLPRNLAAIDRTLLERKTSDWILQEIGLVIGRGMSVILLVEDGVRLPGSLQGNLEYISFARAAVQKSFEPLLQMIGALRPPIVSSSAGSAETAPPPEADTTTASTPRATASDVDAKPSETSVRMAVYDAAIDQDFDAVEKALAEFRAFVNPAEQEFAELRGIALRFLQDRGKGTYAMRIAELSSQHPTSWLLSQTTGFAFEKLRENDLAYAAFIRAAELSADPSDRTRSWIAAARTARLADRIPVSEAAAAKAGNVLQQPFEGRAALLADLAGYWKSTGDWDRFFALSEHAMHLDPSLTGTRFSIAYEYGERSLRELALYHYRTLVETEADNSTAWNNLGVEAAALQLPASSVKAQKRARGLKNALAAGNLAHDLIDAGFLEEASILFQEAVRDIGEHERLTSAQARILAIPREEEGREADLLKKTQPVQRFLRRWGEAYLASDFQATSLRFKGKLAQGKLYMAATIDVGGRISGSAVLTEDRKSKRSLLATVADHFEARDYRLSGLLSGRAGRITLTEVVSDTAPTRQTLQGLFASALRTFDLLFIVADSTVEVIEKPFSVDSAPATFAVRSH